MLEMTEKKIQTPSLMLMATVILTPKVVRMMSLILSVVLWLSEVSLILLKKTFQSILRSQIC